MPIRTERHDGTTADLASRLSALGLAAGPVVLTPESGPPPARGGWLPDQPRTVEARPPRLPPAAVPPWTSLLRASIEDRLPVWLPAVGERVGRRAALAVLAVIVLAALGVVAVVHHRSAAAGYAGSSWPGSSSTGAADVAGTAAAPADGTTGQSTSSSSIVVDVGGKVRRPGLVTLPPGSRVADAIAAAGGALRPRDVATLDLAAKVGDGQLVLVGAAAPSVAAGDPSSGTSSGGGSGPVAPVDLSSADLTTLETLPGIGPVTAQKIIDWGTAHNGFTSIEQLQQVPGIGPADYAEIRALVTP